MAQAWQAVAWDKTPYQTWKPGLSTAQAGLKTGSVRRLSCYLIHILRKNRQSDQRKKLITSKMSFSKFIL